MFNSIRSFFSREQQNSTQKDERKEQTESTHDCDETFKQLTTTTAQSNQTVSEAIEKIVFFEGMQDKGFANVKRDSESLTKYNDKQLSKDLPFLVDEILDWSARFTIKLKVFLIDMHTTTDRNFVAGLIDLLAGSLGGIAQVYVSQPFDTVKVKQQTFPKIYKNMFQCFMKTYRTDGIFRGLYAGSVPAVVANVAENSVLFAAYGGCQKFVAYLTNTQKVSDLTVLENAFAGFLAAFFSTFTLCPTELIKCKLQALGEMKKFTDPVSKTMPKTPWKLTRYIYEQEGLNGFFRGLKPTFVREMPGYFFFFGAYEGTRDLFRKPGQSKDDIGALRTMAAGAIGGTALWTATFPADVIKSRIQIQNINKGMLTVGMDIIKHEGIMGLYNGLLPSIIRTIPATATLLLVYENTKKILHNI